MTVDICMKCMATSKHCIPKNVPLQARGAEVQKDICMSQGRGESCIELPIFDFWQMHFLKTSFYSASHTFQFNMTKNAVQSETNILVFLALGTWVKILRRQ